jgi:chaperonin GroES
MEIGRRISTMLKGFSHFSRGFTAKLTIAPLGSRVIVQLDKAAEKVGSLYVPQTAQQQTNQGEVLAVGPGAVVDGNTLPMTLKVGQRVLLPAFGGQVVKLGKDEYTIVEEDHVLAVFV